MTGGAVIGALRVVLGADTAALEKGLKGAQSSLGKFAAGIGKFGAAAAAGLAAAGAALGVAIKGTINDADKLGKMAQSIGIPVDELSRLKHAADLSDVSIDTLATSVGRLSRNMAEAAREPAGQMAQAFKAIGVSVTNADGTLKSSSQVLTEIAGKFATYKDGAEKTALAIEIFGRAGAGLIPMLNAGAEGMRAMMQEADQLGIVIDSQTAAAAEAFNDNLTRLGKVKDGIILKITSQMLPAFENFSNMLVKAANSSDGLKMAADGLVFILRSLTTVVIGIGTALVTFSTALAGIISAIILAGQGQWSAALEALKQSWTDTVEQFKTGGELIRQAWQDGAEGAKGAAETTRTAAAPMIQSASEVAKSAREAEREWTRLAEAGKRTFEQTRTPIEQFSLTIQKLNEQFAAGAISADTYGRAVAQAQDRMVQANPHAQNLGSALETAFGRAIEKGANFGEILKSLVVDLLKMEATTGFRTLLYGNAGMGGSTGGFLGGLFSMFTGLPGFASGGSFAVAGSGGVDSQLVAFRATPGEQVTVSKKGQGFGSGMLDVRISLDNELLRAVVVDESGRVVAQAAPGIVNAATQNAVKAVPAARRNRPGMFG